MDFPWPLGAGACPSAACNRRPVALEAAMESSCAFLLRSLAAWALNLKPWCCFALRSRLDAGTLHLRGGRRLGREALEGAQAGRRGYQGFLARKLKQEAAVEKASQIACAMDGGTGRMDRARAAGLNSGTGSEATAGRRNRTATCRDASGWVSVARHARWT